MSQTTSEIRRAYDAAARSYSEKFLNELQQKPKDLELLNRFSQSIPNDGRVIDVGCGPGHTTAHLASLGVVPVGVDLAPGMIAMARSHFPELEFAVDDFFQLQPPDQSFVGCLAFYCIVNLQREQLELFFREIHRVLKSDGLLLLSFHVGTEPVYVSDFLGSGSPLEFFRFSVDEVTTALTAVGFRETEAIERPPYECEYPTQRCYVFARRD